MHAGAHAARAASGRRYKSQFALAALLASLSLTMADIADLRAIRIASKSLSTDLANLKRTVEGKPIPPDTRIVDGVMQHKYQGHVHRRTQYDPRNPAPPPYGNPLYTSSNWAYGARATTVHPTSGQHTYDTGNLYRTVHWRDEGFGLNGYFTDDLNRAGMWRHEGLNCAPTKSRTMANPSQWGTPAQGMSTI